MLKQFFLLFLLVGALSASAQQNTIPNQYLVLLDARVKPAEVESQFLQLGGSALEWKRSLGRRFNMYLVQTSHPQALELLQRTPGIRLAQHNHAVQLRATTPDDPQFVQQWGLDNTGQSGGTADADIDAPEAWDITTGGLTVSGDTIVVAVIDGGFQLNHPDLVNNFFINHLEIAGNGIDDDGNGYIDDVNGWNAFNDNGTITSDQHGTHVAGIVSAQGNNGIGVSGVNWDAKVMAIEGSSGDEATVVAAYAYAAEMRMMYNETNGASGAYVVATNSSFGVDNGNPADYPIWCAFYDTLGAHGILSAGATANANYNIDVTGDIPTACASDFLVAVTNSTRTDTKSTAAGYGLVSIDIAAPGTQVYSTVPTSTYANLSGTSMATPHVAGVIGLMYAAGCDMLISDSKSNPEATALQMRQYLLNGADVVPGLTTQINGGRRLNAHGALLQVQNYICNMDAPPNASFNAQGRSGCPELVVQFNNVSSSNADAYYWEFPGGTPSTSTDENPLVSYDAFGDYDVRLIASNSFGSDTLDLPGYVSVNTSGIRQVFTEDFENGFGNWTINNPDGLNTWELFNDLIGNPGSIVSAGVNIFDNTSNAGTWDYLVSPPIDLSTTSNNTLSFEHAHRRVASGTTAVKDTLEVSASLDGGQSWTVLLRRPDATNAGLNSLATATTTNGAAFYPEDQEDWCTSGSVGIACLSTSLSAFDGSTGVLVRFGMRNNGGNNLFLDDISISGNCTTPVVNPAVAAFAIPSQTFCVGQPVTFINQSQNASLFEWTFDGANPGTANQANPVVTYNAAGTYAVSLIASNAQYSDTLTQSTFITISESPVAPVISGNGFELSIPSGENIQWYFNGTLISGATGLTYTATQNGQYSVTVTNASGCSASAADYTVTGVAIEDAQWASLNVYPNPANEVLYIDWTGNDAVEFVLRDMTGRLLLQTKQTAPGIISLVGMPAGTYVAELHVGNRMKPILVVHP